MRLAIEMDDGTQDSLRVSGAGPVVIGRDESCHVVLPSPDVSREHVTLVLEGPRVRLTDGSANGTVIGDKLITGESVLIERGEPFHVGPYVVRVLADSEDTVEEEIRVTDPGPAPPSSPSPRQPADRLVVDTDVGRPTLDVISGTPHVPPSTRRVIRAALLSHVGTAPLEDLDPEGQSRVRATLAGIVREMEPELPAGTHAPRLVDEMVEELTGLGPLRALLADPTVREITMVDPETVVVERGGRRERIAGGLMDEESALSVVRRLLSAAGVDDAKAVVHATLPDGSSLAVVLPPVAHRGPTLVVRKAAKNAFSLDDLVRLGTLSRADASALGDAVEKGRAVLVAGPSASGRTSLVNALASRIPPTERIVSVETRPELRLAQPDWTALIATPEAPPAALIRMARDLGADRILLGEADDPEAAGAFLRAVAEGPESGMAAVTATDAASAVDRLAGSGSAEDRASVLEALDIVVCLGRGRGGARRAQAVVTVDPSGDLTPLVPAP